VQSNGCSSCEALRAQLADSLHRVERLELELERNRAGLREAANLAELQRADLERYKAAYAEVQPNTPERVPAHELQLGFASILASYKDVPATRFLAEPEAAPAAVDQPSGRQAAPPPTSEACPKATSESVPSPSLSDGPAVAAEPSSAAEKRAPRKRKRDEHGRRRLDLTSLPIERVVIDPDHVVAAGGVGFETIGEEMSERIALRLAAYVRLQIVRRKWRRAPHLVAVPASPPADALPRMEPDLAEASAGEISPDDDSCCEDVPPPSTVEATASAEKAAQSDLPSTPTRVTMLPERSAVKEGTLARLTAATLAISRVPDAAPGDPDADTEEAKGVSEDPGSKGSKKTISIAELPNSVWPKVMADPSVIAHTIISKYDDSLPLHRQERISRRDGFTIPRSTQCGWLGEAWAVLHRIVEAMHQEACTSAFCIALDSTGAPVRALGKCVDWDVFVLVADRDHVIFRFVRSQTGPEIESLLPGFRGHVLADAAPMFDVLYRGGEIIEVACWFHARRYFWRALGVDRPRALEALSLIGKLFEVEREYRHLGPEGLKAARNQFSRPILDVFDAWIERNRAAADERGPLAAAIGYYTNQREALRRFLEDGRLRLDNSVSEQQLRALVLGRANWTFFENRTGLRWYTTFRSLIASCALHGVNAQHYLEQVLRLAPDWPVKRILELAPKYWTSTIQRLDDDQRATIEPPWKRRWPTVDTNSPPSTLVA